MRYGLKSKYIFYFQVAFDSPAYALYPLENKHLCAYVTDVLRGQVIWTKKINVGTYK